MSPSNWKVEIKKRRVKNDINFQRYRTSKICINISIKSSLKCWQWWETLWCDRLVTFEHKFASGKNFIEWNCAEYRVRGNFDEKTLSFAIPTEITSFPLLFIFTNLLLLLLLHLPISMKWNSNFLQSHQEFFLNYIDIISRNFLSHSLTLFRISMSEIIPRFFRYAMRELMSKNIPLILQQHTEQKKTLPLDYKSFFISLSRRERFIFFWLEL